MQETLQKHTATENNALVYDTCYFILSSGPEQLYIIFSRILVSGLPGKYQCILCLFSQR